VELFISNDLSKFIWNILLVINKKWVEKSTEIGGAVILVSILINWLLLIWISAAYCSSVSPIL
jgi:hypothetical protein